MNEPSNVRLSAMYQKAPKTEPGLYLDRLVQQAAHAAVARKSKGVWFKRWGLAASLMLGAGISWQLFLGQPDMPLSSLESAVPTEASESAEADSTGVSLAPSPAPPAVLQKRREPSFSLRDEQRMEQVGRAKGSPQANAMEDRVLRRSLKPAAACELDDKADRQRWVDAIAVARAAGDETLVECLEAGLQRRFGDTGVTD